MCVKSKKQCNEREYKTVMVLFDGSLNTKENSVLKVLQYLTTNNT